MIGRDSHLLIGSARPDLSRTLAAAGASTMMGTAAHLVIALDGATPPLGVNRVALDVLCMTATSWWTPHCGRRHERLQATIDERPLGW